MKREEENFIERRRQWKGGKGFSGPRMSLTMIPAIVVCVFLLMAAPYLGRIISQFGENQQEEVVRPVDTWAETEVAPEVVVEPPINPEMADALFYQKLYDEQGFDWRNKPEIEIQEEAPQVEEKIKIEPVSVELPVVLTVTSDSQPLTEIE
tara:strand:+ start:202 stop:654 length:453 start_codon:yes stop_codon:yes gene_type:complete